MLILKKLVINTQFEGALVKVKRKIDFLRKSD